MVDRPFLVNADVLEALLPAAASFYHIAADARKRGVATAPSEDEMIALHIAIMTLVKELGIQERPLYKSIASAEGKG